MAKKVGRPSSLDQTAITKLEMAFKLGANVSEALNFAEVGRMSLHRYCEKHPEFREKIALWRTTPVFEAKKRVLKEIVQNQNAFMAMELLKLDEKRKVRRDYARRWREEHNTQQVPGEQPKTPSGFMKQFLSELNGEESEDEQQDS